MAANYLKLVSLITLVELGELVDFSTSDNSNSYKSRVEDYSLTGGYTDPDPPIETNRKVYFPPGAKLTLEPTLEVPVLDPSGTGVGSKVKLSFPLEIMFHKLNLIWKPKNLFDENEVWNWEKSFKNGRYKRSFHLDSNSSLELTASLFCQSGGTDRITIFKKLEGFWNSYYPAFGSKGVDGKACLLRTICEIHEYPMDCAYGTMGEVAKLVLSASKIKDSCHIASNPEAIMLAGKLKDYALAESNGKNRRCKKYTKSCDISLFV